MHPSKDEIAYVVPGHGKKAERHPASVPAKARPIQPRQNTSQSSTSDEPEKQDRDQSDDRGDEDAAMSEEDEQLSVDRELQQKSQVDLQQIESSLSELSQELDQILAGQISNKKQILMTEENLTKAMLKIDAVESGGDDAIRKKRKELINRAEQLLVKVDEFKRKTKTSAFNINH